MDYRPGGCEKKGPYQTGLKIQTFVGIKKGTGKSPKDFCFDFLYSKDKNKTTNVLSICPESLQGIFGRQCIEVEESITEGNDTQTYHLIYTVFWSDESDLGVITIAGAPVSLWPQFEKTFQAMSVFELIDMKKLEGIKPASASSHKN